MNKKKHQETLPSVIPPNGQPGWRREPEIVQTRTSETYLDIRDDDDDRIDIESDDISINTRTNSAATHKEGKSSWMQSPFYVFLALVVFIGSFVTVACVIAAIHRVEEGSVGVYFKNGALLDDVSPPGLHWAQPFVTDVRQIRVRPESHRINPLICTTKDGVKNVFRDVEVISSIDPKRIVYLVQKFGVHMKTLLVYDRISEAIQLFCSNSSIDDVYIGKFLDIIDFVDVTLKKSLARFAPDGAIRVWNVFLPKPDVPPAIAANYKMVKIEWTKKLVAEQKRKTELIEKETQKLKALADAEREKDVELINIARRIQEEEGAKNVSAIRNELETERMKSDADANKYVHEKEAESNKVLLTDQFVRLEIAKAVGNNTKMFFSGGDSIVGSILNGIYNRSPPAALDENN